jgi:DNA-binding XRE family transcriptional regulator
MLPRSKTSTYSRCNWASQFPISLRLTQAQLPSNLDRSRLSSASAPQNSSYRSTPTVLTRFPSELTRNQIRWYPERGYDRLSTGASRRLNSLRAQFGQRIRQIRDEMDKSQEEFAELVGMSVDFLSLIERGRNAPSFKKLELMIKGLGVSAAYLFTFENSATAKKKRKSRVRH